MQPPQQTDAQRGSDNPLDSRQLRRVATGLADQFELLYGASPVDPRVQMAGDMLTFTFQGGLSRSDEQHLAAGHLDEVQSFRERFLEVAAEQLETVVAVLTGGRVTHYSGAFDPISRTTNLFFLIDLPLDDGATQREAVRNWSAQVRRNARALRLSHLQTREAHIVLRQQMRESWERLDYDERRLEDA
jgi:Na+-translocating membrane potential-generating system (MpsC)